MNGGPPSRACNQGQTALRDLIDAEYAFGTAAKSSVRTAFLTYLAEDSVLLQPELKAGRAFYTAAKEANNPLLWYPSVADAAMSGDLGFSTGPWTSGELRGHYLTIWSLTEDCTWQVQVDGGVASAAPPQGEAKLIADRARLATTAVPAPKSVSDDAVGDAIREFRIVVEQEGLAAALRTYGRNGDFLMYIDDQAPFAGVDPANSYLVGHAVMAASREHAQGRSSDSTMAYSVGEILNATQHTTHTYVQVWQYDSKVSNWGVRVLLLNALMPGKG